MKRVILINGLLSIVLLLALGAMQGCGEKKQTESKSATVSKEDVKEEVKEVYDATGVYTQEQTQAFIKQTETRLDEYGKEIDKMQAMAEKLGEDGKAKVQQQLTSLRQNRDKASEKLKELGSSSGNAWEQIKSGIDAAMEDLGDGYKNAMAELSKS